MVFNFADNTKVSTLDTVPEQFRPLYTQAEDGFVLDSNDPKVGAAVSAITGLNGALIAARGDAKAAKAAAAEVKQVDLSPLADWGDTPTAVAEKVQALLADASKGPGVDIEKIKADLARAHAKDLEKANTRGEALQGQLYKLLVENKASSEIAKQKGDATLLLPFVKDHVRVTEDAGAFTVSVVDKAGDLRYSGVTGNPMSVEELVGEMKGDPTYGALFTSETPAGGGTPPGPRPKPGDPKRELSSTEKIAAGLAAQRK